MTQELLLRDTHTTATSDAERIDPDQHPESDDAASGTAAFLAVRPKLLSIAYRYVRSMSEAEDVVQEVWIRWQTTDRSVVRNPPAFLTTATARLAINVTQSAHKRRVVHPGPSFADPVEPGPGPADRAEQTEDVEDAMLRVLERLSPTERAAYVLREAFGYPYQQISQAIDVRTAHARQLVRRAGIHMTTAPARPVDRDAHRRLVQAFIRAAQEGDVSDLEGLLAGARADERS